MTPAPSIRSLLGSLVCLLGGGLAAHAAGPAPATPTDSTPGADLPALPDLTSALGRMLIIVGVLCGILLIALWWPRRGVRARMGGSGSMRVLDTLELGQGRRLILVDVRGRVRLIGVTAQTITCLSADADLAQPMPAVADAPASDAFSSVFRGPGRPVAGGVRPVPDADAGDRGALASPADSR